MKYTTLYLKSESYEAFYAECEKAGLVFDSEIKTGSHNHCLVLLPNLRKKTGAILTDNDGFEYEETEKLDGYHANLRYKKEIGIEHLAVEVDSPCVIFA